MDMSKIEELVAFISKVIEVVVKFLNTINTMTPDEIINGTTGEEPEA